MTGSNNGSPAAGLPAAAAVAILSEPLAVAIVRNGCSGYWLVNLADDKASAAALIASINLALGVTAQQSAALFAGSLFGFDCPAARPENYTPAGAMVRT